MNTSVEAVDTAAWEMFQQEYPMTWAKELRELDPVLRDTYLSAAREVLEAFGPQAFELAAKDGWKALLYKVRGD